jgi:hypothetical protein
VRLLALLALVVAAPAAAATHALVIGSNEGLAEEPPLAHAESDAALVARALVEMEVAPAGQVRLLAGAGVPALAAALAGLGSGGEDTVFLFFSGHGGADGAHVAGRVWSWPEIRALLAALPARLVIGFFDACRSGALVTAKGELVRGPPLAMSVQPLGPRGRFLVTSSGASELSYESTLLGGSPFAVALRSGLRGGADADGDGRVTVAELYAFVYGRTVAATLAAPTGPQHPAELAELRGTGEVVLVSRLGPARVGRDPARSGTCYFLDSGEIRVVAELPARAAPLALPLGSYVVKCLEGGELRAATITVQAGNMRLDEGVLRSAPRSYALAKGNEGGGLQLVGGGGAVDGSAALRLGLRFARGGLSLTPEVLATRHRLAAGAGFGAALPWWRVLGTQLEVGVSGSAGSDGALLGPYLELARPLGRSLELTARAALLTLYPWGSEGPSGVWLFSLGLRLGMGGGRF